MTTALQLPQQQGALTVSALTRDQVELIKSTIAKGATDDELKLFVEICNRRGLDPFSKQVYFVKGVGVVSAIDGLRCTAARSGAYVPGDTTYTTDADGNLVSATVSVKRLVAGEWHTISETAFLSEYKQNTPIWNRMPHVMLAKCAEARALRRAFPEDVSGLYTQEEITEHPEPEPRNITPIPQLQKRPVATPETVIDAYQKKLGVSQHLLERYIQRPATEWQEPDIKVLRSIYKQIIDGEKSSEEIFG